MDLCKIDFVINGEPVLVREPLGTPVCVAAWRAARLTNQSGRPFRDWEIRVESGQRLDMDTPVEKAGTLLYMTLAVGAGGSA